MTENSEAFNALVDLSMSIQKHDAALEALKDVPLILSQLSKKVGVSEDKSLPPKDWSLGLSDDDDTEADANKMIETETSDELAELLKDVENTVDFGPSLLDNVKSGFAKTATRPLTKESKLALKEKIRIPENCKEFVVPKVNTEIWRLLPSQAKIHDINQQQIQYSLSSGLSALALIANSIVSNKDAIPKNVVSSVIKQAMDGANLLGDQLQSITHRRRFDMKRHLNPEYAGICAAQFPHSEWLFGTELSESLKASKATSILMKTTINRGGRYHPYSQPRQGYQGQGSSRPSLNWNRPFQHQSRGNGPYQPRFDRRPHGQPRMLNQNFQNNRYHRN